MNKKIILTMLALSLLAAGATHAGSFGVGASYWDTEDVGESAGGGIQFAFQMTPLLDFETRATYFKELSDEPLDELFDGDSPFDTGLTAIPVEIGLRLNFARDAASFRPYASAGASYYILDSEFGDVDDEYGWYAGLGTSIGGGNVAFFAEILYRSAEGTADISEIGDDAFDDTLPIDLTGFGANAGIRWNW